jgi:prepilin-type N-terminal cleavage/methylation domain-containing protein
MIMRALNNDRQRGITLIELMVSITVGLILLSGIISIFVSNKQAYRLQESTNILNENARYALNQIQYDLRMGDHWGGVEASAISVETTVAITDDCSQSPALTAIGFIGFEGAATSPLDCVPASDYQPNTDMLIIRYGEPRRVAIDPATTAIYLRTAIGRRAVIFQGTGVNALPADILPNPLPPAPETATEFANYDFRTVVYFIRKCASQDFGTPNVCDAADDTTPTLTRLVLSGTQLVEEDIIAGVEQLQITYGVLDESVDPPQIQYFDATTITTNSNWNRVTNVQISLVIRGEEYDATFTDTRTFDMYGGFPYTPVAADRHFRRKLYNFVVQIRNLTRA